MINFIFSLKVGEEDLFGDFKRYGEALLPIRLDVYLTTVLAGKFSRSEVKGAIDSGKILLDKKPTKPGAQVNKGNIIEGEIQSVVKTHLQPEDIPIQVIYEDEDLLVVDKPVGMVVHPGAGNKEGTLVHALLGRGGDLSDVGGRERPGIVHRLDKETSGLLVVAKNNRAHRLLQAQFQARTFVKVYTALVKGPVEFEEGHVSLSIGRDPKIRQKMAVSSHESARTAETQYRVLKRYRYSTLLEVRISTGRTHQIRVHMAHLGNPVVGDEVYGTRRGGEPRLALHATKIEFTHPTSGKIMKFESPLSDEFKDMIKKAEKQEILNGPIRKN